MNCGELGGCINSGIRPRAAIAGRMKSGGPMTFNATASIPALRASRSSLPRLIAGSLLLMAAGMLLLVLSRHARFPPSMDS